MAPNRNSIQRRHTGPLITDPAALAEIEAKNALLQFDEVRRLIAERLPSLNLTPHDVRKLNRLAIEGIYEKAGEYRDGPISINNTIHQPPSHEHVERHVTDMCDYANSVASRPLHVAAYLMWRLNWIHPFPEGNGRTSRAVSYLGLCCGYGMEMPGVVTVPDLIVANRGPYYAALDEADAAWKGGRIDVTAMEGLIENLLVQQLNSMSCS